MDNWCLVVDGEPTHAESLRVFCENASRLDTHRTSKLNTDI